MWCQSIFICRASLIQILRMPLSDDVEITDSTAVYGPLRNWKQLQGAEGTSGYEAALNKHRKCGMHRRTGTARVRWNESFGRADATVDGEQTVTGSRQRTEF